MVATKPTDFPSIYRDFVKLFAEDSACAAYLERLRWPLGFVCPACQHQRKPWRQTRGRLVCPACHHETSVIVFGGVYVSLQHSQLTEDPAKSSDIISNGAKIAAVIPFI